MRYLVPLFSLLIFALPSCGGEAGASGNAAGVAGELTKVLTGITDGKTAEAAKDKVTSLTDQLTKAIDTAKAAVAGAADKAKEVGGGGLGEVAKGVAGKAGEWLSPQLKEAFSGITSQVDRLMGNADIKNVLGSTLEKLKGLVTSAD